MASKQHVCPVCGENFSSGAALGGHMSHHSDAEIAAAENKQAQQASKPQPAAPVQEPQRDQAATDSAQNQDATSYPLEDLVDNAQRFGVKPEVVAGALRLAGKAEATIIEAEEHIKRFLEREV